MKTAVRYYSRSGNTKKLADAIAAAVGVDAMTVSATVGEPVDILFVGGAVYAGEISRELRIFLENLSPDEIRQVAVFSSAAGHATIYGSVKALADAKGIAVADCFFSCRGEFVFANKGRPNAKDLAEAADWAKSFIL